jgi:hypothetical protein
MTAVTFGAARVAAQTTVPAANAKPAAAKKASTVPRLADGKPDLQGIWSFSTVTPVERPKELGDKEFLTAAEAKAFAEKVIAAENKDARASNAVADVESAYNDFWWDRGTEMSGTRRTSLVVMPKDGRIPPLTALGQKKAAVSRQNWLGAPSGPEDRSIGERCIMGFNAGPPMAPSAYNNNVQIFQAGQTVALLNEMVHNARIIQMDGRAHLPQSVRQWAGDSRGRWDGDTLVIETTNFNEHGTGQVILSGASSADMVLVERFTRTDATNLMYEFTVTDPAGWTAPWTVQLPMVKSSEPMYEYACHEGNHAMLNMLSGARAKDTATAAQGAK